MNRETRMNRILRIVALLTGVAILIVSIYWSQDGFNFGPAGDSGYTQTGKLIAYTLAIAVTVIQFVFNTNLDRLNSTLIVFGGLAYAYSVWTNKIGIVHFQGANTNEVAAWILGFCVDGVPEPLIAWAFGESLSGDLVGNAMKSIGKLLHMTFGAVLGETKTEKHHNDGHNRHQNRPQQQGKGKPGGRREFLERQYRRPVDGDDSDRFPGFGEE